MLLDNPPPFVQGFIHLFYPRLCEGCRKPLHLQEDLLCIGCETNIAYTNFHHLQNNEAWSRLSGRLPFSHATSLAYFGREGLLQQLIHGLKYKGKQGIGRFLGKALGKCIKPERWEIDAIVPVPLHKKKEQKRGYNQSRLIANGMSEVMDVPVLNNIVVRTRFTESQTDKTREQRLENVSRAFALANTSLAANKHLLVVDDVLTTGATIEACALALLAAPGVEISIATVGIAG